MNPARVVIFGVALTSTACVIGPNPDFIEDGGTAGETDGQSNDESALTCGDKICELDGGTAQCVDGQCVGTLSVAIEDDTYVDGDQPTTNFGEQPTLRVDDLRDAYILLPDLPSSGGVSIESIGLHLNCSVAGATVGVYEVGGNWTELSVTQGNAPGIGGTELTSFTATPGDNVVEIVDLVFEWQNAEANRGLGLRLLDGGDIAPNQFSSSEGAAPPYLEIELIW